MLDIEKKLRTLDEEQKGRVGNVCAVMKDNETLFPERACYFHEQIVTSID
jgi:hypothetical protein